MKVFVIVLFAWLTVQGDDQVYICKSGTSYAYHKGMCQGLRHCSHKIVKVTIEQAVKSGHKKPCGYCFR